MKKSIFLLFALAGLCSCGQKSTGPVPVFDLSRTSYPLKELVLQDIATVEYIPLETKEGFLLGGFPTIQYMDDELIVTNGGGYIMFFDRKTGKALRSFNRTGRGPGEYRSVHAIAIDRKADEMFVTEGWYSVDGISPLHVYDLQGKHLRTFDFSREGFQNYIHVYDDSTLFLYDKNVENHMPYKRLSRTDSSFIHLPVEFPDRDHMDVTGEQENGTYVVHFIGTTVLKTPEGYIFSEPGVDTLYSWNRSSGRLTPLIATTPSFASMETPAAIFVEAQNSDYLFLSIKERRQYEYGDTRKYDFSELLYDKTDGQFYESSITNGDYVDGEEVNLSNLLSKSVSCPAGQFVVGLQAYQLVDLYKEGKLQGELEQIASSLTENDNTVLLIGTFK